MSAAFVLLVFFAFNKQAFINYYFSVVGALCVAAAAASQADGVESERRVPLDG